LEKGGDTCKTLRRRRSILINNKMLFAKLEMWNKIKQESPLTPAYLYIY